MTPEDVEMRNLTYSQIPALGRVPLAADVPGIVRIDADGRRWDANCAWDAFGICAALGTDGTIDTAIRGCSSMASCLQQRGGRTSSSPEAR